MLGVFLRPYATLSTVAFNLPSFDGQTLKVDATFAAGDVKISKDNGAEANSANLPVDRGSYYTLDLTASELTAKRVMVTLVDQTNPNAWLPDSLVVETTEHPSSQHPDPWLLDSGTAQAVSGSGLTLRSGAPPTPKGSLVLITSATTGVNQVGVVLSRAGDVVTLEQTWTDGGGVQPTGTVSYKVYASPPAPVAIAADMVRVNGDATSAARMAKSARSIVSGLVQSGTLTVNSFTNNLAGTVAEQYDDRMVAFLETTTTAALRGVTKPIDSFTPGSPATLALGYRDAANNLIPTPLPVAPAIGDEFVVI